MPVCTICLLSLNVPVSDFCRALYATPLKPLVLARVLRWIVQPTTLSKDALLSQDWDVLLIVHVSNATLLQSVAHLIHKTWTIQGGVPSRILASYDKTNASLLDPDPENIPRLTRSSKDLASENSSQNLELSGELHDWIGRYQGPEGAVSMLNFLAFQEGKREQYANYGKAFAESVGIKRGGIAKLVGKVVPETCSDGCNEWEEASSEKAINDL
ncbi:hypothetical protein ACLMJK_001467 [Lecanora helva]